ncbi:conserved hypothetical protein [Clostridium neonatale]|uniref:hypothetical protein n=1 Tax=Clostridium neonatale TaxID=137838 RepID=UPI00291BDBF9|nr:hypothetical protein [Clostridium neonatale]CAI3605834.1 conserved hypothetical protein [Clostridium neonatale]
MFGLGKKKNINKDIHCRVSYYEGLPNFQQLHGCELFTQGDTLIIRQIRPEITVRIKLSQIETIDVLPENTFMMKYKNTSAQPNNTPVKVSYYIFNYVSSNGENAMFVLSGAGMEIRQIYQLQKMINQSKGPQSYDL